MLGAWILWKHRNSCVFYGSAPNIQIAIQAFKDEANLWIAGGAKGLAGWMIIFIYYVRLHG